MAQERERGKAKKGTVVRNADGFGILKKKERMKCDARKDLREVNEKRRDKSYMKGREG